MRSPAYTATRGQTGRGSRYGRSLAPPDPKEETPCQRPP